MKHAKPTLTATAPNQIWTWDMRGPLSRHRPRGFLLPHAGRIRKEAGVPVATGHWLKR
ncbi:hypothetical protein WME94_30620 [Sorangium sp. So ce429]